MGGPTFRFVLPGRRCVRDSTLLSLVYSWRLLMIGTIAQDSRTAGANCCLVQLWGWHASQHGFTQMHISSGSQPVVNTTGEGSRTNERFPFSMIELTRAVTIGENCVSSFRLEWQINGNFGLKCFLTEASLEIYSQSVKEYDLFEYHCIYSSVHQE